MIYLKVLAKGYLIKLNKGGIQHDIDSNIFMFLEITMFNINPKTLRKILKLIEEVSNGFLF